MIKGSCCCGAVQFALSEVPGMMGTCHCSRCRKVGAGTLVFVRTNTFELIQGEEHIGIYKAEPPYQYDRCFCSVCGTALGEILSEEGTFPIAANCIDSELPMENTFHEFVSEKPAWHKIGEGAKQFDEHPA